MAITCALGADHIEILTRVISKAMLDSQAKGELFDVDGFMNKQYTNLKKRQGVDNAIQYMQQMPTIINLVATRKDIALSKDKAGVEINLLPLSRAFRNQDNGIQVVYSYFEKTLTPEQLALIATDNSNKPIDLYEPADEVPPLEKPSDRRLKVRSIFSGTYQEFIAKSPKTAIEEFEVVDKDNITAINTIGRLSINTAEMDLLDNAVIDGVRLKLKPIPLNKLSSNDRTRYSNNIVATQNAIINQGTKNKVTPVSEQFALVVTDQNGNFVYFTKDGRVTTKEEGRIVYQMMRDVRFENGKYRVTDIYGIEDQIMSPEEIALDDIKLKGYKSKSDLEKVTGISFSEYVKNIENQQQKEFKQVYDLRQKLIKGADAVTLNITGASRGVFNFKIINNIKLNNLSSYFSEETKTKIIDSLFIVPKGATISGLIAGRSGVEINGEIFELDRPNVNEETARKVAAVLSNPKISDQLKREFYYQFFTNQKIDVPNSTQRHNITETGKLMFYYAPFTLFEAKQSPEKAEQNKQLREIDLNSKTAESDIYDIFMSAQSNKTDVFSSKIVYRPRLLNEEFSDYENGEFVLKNYSEFLANQDARIIVKGTGKVIPLYNSYINYTLNDTFVDQVNEAKESVEEDTRSDIRKFKDDLVDVIKNSPDQKVLATVKEYTREGDPKTGTFSTYITIEIEGQEGEHKLMKSLNEPEIGETLDLIINPIEIKDGFGFPNNISAVKKVGNNTVFYGNLQETDFGIEDPRSAVIMQEEEAADVLEAEALDEIEEAPKTVSEEESQVQESEGLNPSNTTDTSSGTMDGLFAEFKRSGNLPIGVTAEQVNNAISWYDKSPLKKYLGELQMMNIVNSDAYARFIVAGSTLIAGQYTGRLGQIQINEATGGSVVDAYHEAWHAFSQLFLTKAEKIALYEELRKSNPKYKNYSFLQLEEILAEDFRSYALNQKTKPKSPKRNSLFRRILNFLKKLFGGNTSISDNIQIYNVESYGVAGELFKNLYLASSNPELLNIYTPSIDNVMFDILNRGIPQANNKNEVALNQKDASDVTESIDSVLSDIVDEQFERQKNSGNDTKAGTTKIVTDPNNRKVAYKIAKLKFQEKIDQIKSKLKITPEKPFASFSTIKDLEDNASAIIRSKNGDHKYIFLTTQIEDYNNLDLATKGDQRVKGEFYKGTIEILGDFYTHNNIKDSTNNNATIIVVNDLSEGKDQYDNYISGGAKSFTAFELNPLVSAKSLSNVGSYQSKLLDNLRVLQTAVKNWDSVIKYHEKNSSFEIIKSSIEIVEDDPTTDVTKSEKVKSEIGKESLFELGGKDVIYILRSLHKKGKKIGNNYEVEYNTLGFKKLVDFKSIWNSLVRITESTKDPNKIYQKIVEASASIPELKQLIDYKLPEPSYKNNDYEFDIVTSFWSVFSLPRVPYMQLSLFETEEGISSEVTEGSLDTKSTVRQFQNAFRQNTDSKFVNTDSSNNVYLDLKKVTKYFADPSGNFDTNKTREFLNALGIYLDNNERINAEINNPAKISNRFGLPFIYNAIKEASFTDSLETKSELQQNNLIRLKTNPIEALTIGIPANVLGDANSTIFKNGTKQKTQIERIAELQVRYGSAPTSFSSTNAERNRVNEHTTDNTLTVIADGLNTTENKTDMYREGNPLRYLDPRRNPMAKSSYVLRNLFDSNGVKKQNRNIKTFQQSGTQETNNKSSDIGQNTTSLSQQGKLLQEFHTMIKSGHQEIMRPGSKSSAWGWIFEGGFVSSKTIKKKSEGFLYADIDSFIPQTGKEREIIEEIILPYLAAETNRINIFKSNPKAKNYIGYNDVINNKGQASGEIYNYFDGILNSTTKAEILQKVNNPETDLIEYLKTDPDLYNKIVNEIASYFDKKSVELLDEIKKAEYFDYKLIKRFGNSPLTENERKQVLVKAYFYNAWIHNVETSILFFTGDIAQLDHSKDAAFKRLSGLVSNGPRIRTDLAAQIYINNASEGGFSENTYAKSLGAKYDKFKYDGYINTALIQDISRNSIYMDEIKEGLIQDFKRRSPNLTDREIALAAERAVNKYSKDKIKEGDGQGYITFDAYRAIKKLQNKWSNDQENLYKKIVNKQKISMTEYLEGFPVLKLQNFGWVEDTILPVQAMHKFALMPLIPSAVKETQLEELHKKMLEQNIQYVTFASGSKISGVTSDGKPDQIFEDGGKKIKADATFTNNKIHAAFIKEATSVPSKAKGKVIFSTQLRKLILEGLKEHGLAVSEKAAQLSDKYESLINFYNKLVRKDLENEIGYRRDEEGTYIGKPAKFLMLIQENLKDKDYPQHLIDLLKTNSDGTLQYDLSYFLDTDTIEKIVMSIVDKKLIKQKVNGDALVQVANSMWNGTWDVTQGNKFANLSKDELEAARKQYLGTNGLPFYTKGKDGKTLPMKVAITLQGDFFNLLNLSHLDGQPIKTVDRLNEMIKLDEWLDINDHRKSVTLTAVRIPVQGLNSMEFMEVYEFLDPSAINMIIPPTEIVAKSGSDFDVDKLTTFFPNINSDGSYAKSSISNENFFKETSALENQDKNPKDIISQQKKAVENEFIETIKSILEIEENYAALVTPNDTSILEDIANDLQDSVSTRDKYVKVNDEEPNISRKNKKYASPTSIFEPITNVEKHAQNLEGKNGLGIVANQNALHPLYTSIGAKMPKKYKAAEWSESLARYIEKGSAIFKMRLFLPHNEIDGHISLSNINTKNNVYKIAEIFSQALNGTVDVEANPWIFYIQGNVQALPVFLYLTEAGVNPEDAVYFISNPLIREYTENQRLKGGVFGRASGMAPKIENALKFESAKQVFDKYKERFVLDRMKSLSNDNPVYIEYFVKNPRTNASEKTSKNITKKEFLNLLPSVIENLALVKATGIEAPIYLNFNPSTKKAYELSGFLSAIPGVLRRGNFNRDSMLEIVKKKGELTPEQLTKSLAMLAHYVEIEQQLRGLSALKRLSKPDVQKIPTPQGVIKRGLDIDLVFENSKIDSKTSKGVLKESAIASFGDKDIVGKIFMPMMELVNGTKTTNFILDSLGGYEGNSKLKDIIAVYGSTQDSFDRYTSDYKTALKTFVFQNYQSDFINENGKFLVVPERYKGLEVKVDNTLNTDVIFKDGVYTINENRLRSDYQNKVYLDTNLSPNGYSERAGLEAFPSNEIDVFPQEALYFKYALERERLNKEGLVGDELNQFALINAFNPVVIFNAGKYSYSDLVLRTINKHRRTLSNQYAIVDQITKYLLTSKENSILTLANRDVIDGNTATSYANEIKQLGNAKVVKVENTETSPQENERLSEIFRLFPLIMIYQHGAGKTKYGFDTVLPQEEYLNKMKDSGALFKNNYQTPEVYNFIFDKLLSIDTEAKEERTALEKLILGEKEEKKKTPKKKAIFINYLISDSLAQTYTPVAVEQEVEGDPEEALTQPTQAPVSAQPTVPVGEVKEGVAELFESNPELANAVYETLGIFDAAGFKETSKYEMSLGEAKFTGVELYTEQEQQEINRLNTQQKLQAQQLYSQYLDTIFPDSKVKDILYRGSRNPNALEASDIDPEKGTGVKNLGIGIYLAKDKELADKYSGETGRTTAFIVNVPDFYITAIQRNYDRGYSTPDKVSVQEVTSNTSDTIINFEYLDRDSYVPFNKYTGKYTGPVDENGFPVYQEKIFAMPYWTQMAVNSNKQIHPLGSKQDIQGFKNFVSTQPTVDPNKTQYQLPQGREREEYVASEKTIRDLAARMSDRIGISVRFESDRTKEYKGKLEGKTAVVNLAYATLDTPIHEILGHPIIRAIKTRGLYTGEIEIKTTGYGYAVPSSLEDIEGSIKQSKTSKVFKTLEEAEEYVNKLRGNNNNILYQNLLKELEYGKGKEVLDRVKRDYYLKSDKYNVLEATRISDEEYNNIKAEEKFISESDQIDTQSYEKRVGNKVYTIQKGTDANKNSARVYTLPTYTLEEQQEEAIVELLGLMTADRLDKVKDGKLISLLKRLLKEIKAFVRDLLKQREVEIDKLPDNMTLGDIADLLAYSNSKIILPGNEVVYTTPDNQQFKTYAEASKHVSNLAKSVEDVDLSKIKLEKKSVIGQIDPITNKRIKNAKFIEGTEPEWSPDDNVTFPGEPDIFELQFDDGSSNTVYDEDLFRNYDEEVNQFYGQIRPLKNIENFIEKNKEYEQSKEIIEEWKKVNNIQYNPEEIYSRGQEFVSVVGAYSNFDVDLMMQNLLQHIEDSEKAGGEFTISAFTKPVDRQIGHLEGGGGRIKFKIYPKSKDIKWAANTDVYSGSVWDASEKVNKDKKSELLGVSYTKYPSLRNINAVQPNLANIIDDLAHHHNELGISLTGNNFRLEYDENIPYSTKKIIDSVNSILDQKYGKLVKPDINKKQTGEQWSVFDTYEQKSIKYFNTEKEAIKYLNNELPYDEYRYVVSAKQRLFGIQPTQTNETLKESISFIQQKLDSRVDAIPDKFVTKGKYKGYATDTWFYKKDGEWYMKYVPFDAPFETEVESYDIQKMSEVGLGIDEVWESYLSTNPEGVEDLQVKQKEYTSQALINTKIAKLKEVAKKYPKSLIRSEVTPIPVNYGRVAKGEVLFELDELPFQKLPAKEPGTVASKTTAQIPLSDTNIAKVLDGSKVVTTRKELIPDDTYLAGNTQQVKIKYLGIARVVGNSVVITNEKTKKSFVRTRNQFAKAEGFKNWSDYTDNNRFIQGFIKGNNTRYVYEISPAGRIQQMGTGQQRINPENNPVIGLFNEELVRTNGVYPKEFIYDGESGINKYVLTENNLYNLVDKDTGSIYLRNIDLTTGNIVSDPLPKTPVGKDSIKEFIDTLNNQIKSLRIDIVLAEKGIDVNEIIDRAENASTEEELNELRVLINKNLC